MLRPGEDWGTEGTLPADAPVAVTDAAAAAAVAAGAAVIALAAGDLCRTLGGRGDVGDRLGSTALLLPVDVVSVVLDGGPARISLAHVIARGRGWSGPAAAVMNAQWLGEWDVAPRAHPGDGRLDILRGALPWRQRMQARRRVRTGDHIPHPDIDVRRAAHAEVVFDRPREVWVDGVTMGRASDITATISDSVLVAV